MNPEKYSDAEIARYLRDSRNWGRWGSDDQLGAVNLVTPDKTARAASLVRQGKTVSLARPLPTRPAGEHPKLAQHYLRTELEYDGHPGLGFAADYFAIDYHNLRTTHLDALCHTWDERGGWNGTNPPDVVRWDGVTKGGVEAWRHGIMTRGVLLDVPRYRNEPFVVPGSPVCGWELDEICTREGITVEPGDAVLVYSGRDEWDRHNPPWDGPDFNGPNARPRPGLHPSCLIFLRDVDCSILVWDMTEAKPPLPAAPWGVHSAIFAFGVGLVDHALLQPLAEECAAAGRWEFFFTMAPLHLVGGTGCPVNPIAVL